MGVPDILPAEKPITRPIRTIETGNQMVLPEAVCVASEDDVDIGMWGKRKERETIMKCEKMSHIQRGCFVNYR